MDKMDLILWVVSGQFAIMLVMWNSLNKRMDRIELRIDKLELRMERLDEKLNDLDRRLCRIEGTLSAKECCMLKEERHIQKAK